jgi:ferredoxin
MTSDFYPKIDPAKCTGCELCVKVCPNDVLSLVDEVAVVSRPDACDYTGACQEICPTRAINLIFEIVFFYQKGGRTINLLKNPADNGLITNQSLFKLFKEAK